MSEKYEDCPAGQYRHTTEIELNGVCQTCGEDE
jgi:hypothetical protein